ncbi:hypothetical protein DFH28DRAFT_1156294 [Melampsora americana]|nr:hypothetical protein DFH28DRAFT_1156294 [Melampsora americana]
MPRRQPSTYFLKPIDPLKPVPYPPADGIATGLICPSVNCIDRPLHSTFYTQQRKIGKQSHLVRLRCKFDTGYFRSYHIARFHSEILDINEDINDNINLSRFLPGQRILLPEQMDIGKFQASNTVSPALPGTQPTPTPAGSVRPSKDSPCEGIHGRFAEGHNTRKNNGCSSHACAECCIQLNIDACSVHTAMRKRKLKEKERPSSQLQQTQATTNQPSFQTNITPLLTQADRTFTRRLVETELRKFHAIKILKQVDERLLQTKIEAAKNIVTMVVWSGEKKNWETPRVFRFNVPQWPLFALEEHDGLSAIVKEQLGDSWHGMLQVYNEQFKTWVHLSMDMVETYSPNSHTILVVFPGIPPKECTGVDNYIALSGRASNAMDIRAFLPPALQHGQSPSTSRLVADVPIVEYVTDSEAESEDIIHLATMTQSTNLATSASSDSGISPTSNPPNATSAFSTSNTPTPAPVVKGWPKGVVMTDMMKFMEASAKGLSNKEAFEMFWDAKAYRKSTVSKYHRLISRIEKLGKGRVQEYMESCGNATVFQVKEHFAAEWRYAESAVQGAGVEGSPKTPRKRVKL